MRNADIFLFPSELEGHPQVLLQAAACGLPCVAMNSYHPDAIVDGDTGFLAKNADEFARRFDELINDPARRWTMSKAATQHAARFDWDHAATQWAEAFVKVVGENA
jgi:glycosyltransferase involved in cell wall biosynthesis